MDARRRCRCRGGYQQLYVDHVLQADTGCDFDFLVGCRGHAVPSASRTSGVHGASMTEPSHDPHSEPRLFRTLRDDVGQVLDDARRRGVRRSIARTFDEIETFYLTEESRRHLRTLSPIPRFAHRFWRLIKSLLMKLTPTRRVMLALGLFLMAFQFEYTGAHVSVNFRWLGDLLLVLVLTLELKDKLIARNELEAGRAVQLALLPQKQPTVPGWDVWLYTQPANDVGGDLVDYMRVDEVRHGLALGDVAGKALPAALLMVKLQATLRALIPQAESLSDFGAAVNRILARDGLINRFATLVYLLLTVDSGAVRLLNAGHPPPLLVRGQQLEELPRGSIALGILPEASFVEQHVELQSGDVLIVYSDGVTEASNAADDFFGDERLRTAIGSVTANRPPASARASCAR